MRRKRKWWSGEHTLVRALRNPELRLPKKKSLTEVDHCMEMMRVSIMCKGSPSLSTFRYISGDPAQLTAVALGHHQCVNWDRLLEWVRERAVPIFEPGVLAGPGSESVDTRP